MTVNDSHGHRFLSQVESILRTRVQKEEAKHDKTRKPPNSLWGHMVRVARLAERIGRAEGVDPTACRLAGFFHDAGKFGGGSYHKDDKPEEEQSVSVLRQITKDMGFNPALINQVEEAILQLYRDDPDPTLLTRVLFDADNLDKLGTLGIANYFVKAGLRGGGISESFLYRATVELTYARYAPKTLATKTGRQLACKRAPETISFFKSLLDSLREDGLFDFRIDEIQYDDMIIDVVSPAACECGGTLAMKIWKEPGLKCSEIHLEHTCNDCGTQNKVRFCRPRLLENNLAEIEYENFNT